MTQLTLPETIAAQLQGLNHAIKLCSPSGATLGRFLPAIDPSQYVLEGPEPSDEDLRAAQQSTDWYTTQEVLQHLEKLA